jgi:UDP-N-acetylglucosamine 1-carboxyvinyltransferase
VGVDRLIIEGGRPLQGSVQICGAKNAALPELAASLLSDRPLTLTNVPDLADITTMCRLLEGYGVKISRPQAATLVVDAWGAVSGEAAYEIVRTMRATILVLGPLLARFGQARVSLPGGCAIGARPVDLHLKALATLGAEIAVEGGYVIASAPSGLTGARVVLPIASVGATETAMMAAALARGESEIVNAAREPEVADLGACLTAMGARVEGAGTHRITIQGVSTFTPASHDLLPDRIEAGTYAVAAAITGGELELIGGRLEQLAAVADVLERAGVQLWPTDRGVMVRAGGRPRPVDIVTEPYPGFPTDLQAQVMALLARADGTSTIRETVFEARFMHVPELARFGADIALSGTTATVRGVADLTGAPVMATDLRASVSLVLAALAARGQSTIHRVYHLDRGYEALDRKLVRCGAAIQRVAS